MAGKKEAPDIQPQLDERTVTLTQRQVDRLNELASEKRHAAERLDTYLRGSILDVHDWFQDGTWLWDKMDGLEVTFQKQETAFIVDAEGDLVADGVEE